MSTPPRPIPVTVDRPDANLGSTSAPMPPTVPADAPPIAQTPPIDIHEEPDGLILEADLPGAPEEAIAIHLADNVLTLEARARCPVPDEARPLHEEFPVVGLYRRTFILSQEVDRSGISAELRHGVLRLTLPKAERAKPRRIEINHLDSP